jgi:cobalamin biosynthesis protein CobW
MSSAERHSVTGEIGKTLPRAVKVVAAENGQVPVAILLGLGAKAESDLANRPSHHDLEGEHDHDDFDTFIIELPAFASPQALVDRMVKAAEAHDVLRMKGFVEIAGKPMRLLVQGVGARIQHQFDRKWPSGAPRRGRLVVIGETGFDRDAIRALILN